jgi:hypothetical protein
MYLGHFDGNGSSLLVTAVKKEKNVVGDQVKRKDSPIFHIQLSI